MKLPRFIPRVPWLGGDLQTLRNYLRPPNVSLDRWPREQVSFLTTDGSGDRLYGELHQPTDPEGRPLVLLLHGLSGSMESTYIKVSTRELLKAGYPVLRLNWRGAGGGHKTKGFYHAGKSDDLHSAIRRMSGQLAARGLLAVGYSLGGNILLNYLAERGSLSLLRAAVSISAPIDLADAQACLGSRRNRRYHDYLLANLCAERGVSEEVGSLLDFDNRFVAPANGFRDARDYYHECSANRKLGAIRTPTLLIHAADDPWIPVGSYREAARNLFRSVRMAVPWSGGHVGFHALGLNRTWHDESLIRFFDNYVLRRSSAASSAK